MNQIQMILLLGALALVIGFLFVLSRITSRERNKRSEIERDLFDLKGRVRTAEKRLEKFEPVRGTMDVVSTSQRPERKAEQSHVERRSTDSIRRTGFVDYEALPPLIDALEEPDIQPRVEERQNPPEEYSEQLVTRLFQDWCRSGERPEPPSTIEFCMAEFVRSEGPTIQGTRSVHIVRDTEKTAEFARFSALRSDKGHVVPNPRAHYTPVVAYLYDGLSREQYENPVALASVRPVRVQRREGAEWEVLQ
jgi:hypothetical protein